MVTYINCGDTDEIANELNKGDAQDKRLSDVLKNWTMGRRYSAEMDLTLDAEDTRRVREIADKKGFQYKEG